VVEIDVLLLDLAVLIIAAEVGGIVFERLRLPRVLGMLVAGIALSRPAGIFAVDPADVQLIAELGAVFLMFSIGLSFNVSDVRRVGARAALLSVNGSGLSFLLGYAAGIALGWGQVTSLYLGLMLMSTSTLITFRLMQDLNLLGMRGADITIASVLLDDVTLLVAITLVQVYAVGGDVRPFDAVLGLLLVFAILALIAMLGLKLVPGALAYFERVSPTSIVLLATASCFLIAYGFTLAKMPPLLGAFLAGTIIASTKYGADVKQWIEPIGGLFTAVFFTAIGLLIDPGLLTKVWLPLLLVLAAAVVGKALGGFLSLASFRTPLYPAAMFSMVLLPRGELTLVVAQIAVSAPVNARPELLALGAMLMFGTTALAPLGVKLVSVQAPLLESLWQRVRRAEGAAASAAPEGEEER